MSRETVGGERVEERLREENRRLRERLEETLQTLEAIRSGEVDAIVASGPEGERVYTLSGAERPYRLLIETIAEGALTLSPEGVILYCNARFAELAGAPMEKVVAASLKDFIGEEDRGRLEDFLARAALEETRVELHLGPGGGGRLVLLSSRRLELDSEVLICAVATDLTEVRAAAEVRARAEAAEAASRAKDQFLAALSHELRTPLTPVLTMAQIMETDPRLSPEARDSAAMIRRNVELESRLIDDLLDLTRVARGKLELRRGMVDLHLKVQQAAQTCMSELESKRQRLSLDLHAPDHQVWGDQARLQQVLWNLLKNAVKFTPAGGSIAVRTENVPGEKIRVQVADTGIGIEPELMPKLFDAFEQGSREVTRRFGGLGLGLAVSKALVDLHGGSLSAASEGKGRGATFTLELAVAAARPEQELCGPPQPAPARAGAGLRVLFVEDHPDTNRVYTRILGAQGYEVQSAPDLATALRLAGTRDFDLLISDLTLPDGTGYELMRRLSLKRPIKGIVFSGLGMEEDVERSLAAGFSAHLTKPVLMEDLLRTIRRVAAEERPPKSSK